ncbi:MAG: aminopeptidase P family protein [Phycisphaerales bacterium]|nr:aminopeptidase P family protein [Phycisphaerales bacterium]
MTNENHTIVMGGVPQTNLSLYHKVRFAVGDPVGYIQISMGRAMERIFILREIELERARKTAHADQCFGYSDFTPQGGLSGDREICAAQSIAECLRRKGITNVTVDRSLPMLFAHVLTNAGISVTCDPDLFVMDRRSKDATELAHLRAAQKLTEECMLYACTLIAKTSVGEDGVLIHDDGEVLTSERVRRMIDIFFLQRGASTPHGSIVAGGPIGADCHHRGQGPLRTREPIIIDIFPYITETHYNGDCTRTVVHGEIPEEVAKMHAAVVEAKHAAQEATKPGVTGEDIHRAAITVIQKHGYGVGIPDDDAPDTICNMVHGTGHGIGLDVHEPPLLDMNGPTIVAGDVITIEPGLYCKAIGGIRVEDMVAVTENGYENFNKLPEGLTWA